ncbi:MAG: hypothetical protein EBT04_02365 [Betaproteobacteria bacterium]|jgi:hypothetical protein|nr:hypothetical protein [Betaproteobacteria bacterium]
MISGVIARVSPHGRGWQPEQIAERFIIRLLHVADTAPQPLRDQAYAFRDQAQLLAIHYMREAVQSDRTTIINRLSESGFHEAAAFIEREL